jgi:hypothetical protein
MHVAHNSYKDPNAKRVKESDEPIQSWHVPPEIVLKVAAFCNEMQAKHPNMKIARIARKAATHFGLKEKTILKDAAS